MATMTYQTERSDSIDHSLSPIKDNVDHTDNIIKVHNNITYCDLLPIRSLSLPQAKNLTSRRRYREFRIKMFARDYFGLNLKTGPRPDI